MKILIVSDTHGKHENLKLALEQEAPIDRMIHLGDAEGCEDFVQRLAGCPVDIVAGNNDFFSQLPVEKTIYLGNYKILVTHGHYYNVNAGIARIKKEADARGFHMVMFGHTHRPVIDRDGEVLALNPGSMSYPRQEGRRPSYIVMDVDGKGEAHFEIKNL